MGKIHVLSQLGVVFLRYQFEIIVYGTNVRRFLNVEHEQVVKNIFLYRFGGSRSLDRNSKGLRNNQSSNNQ